MDLPRNSVWAIKNSSLIDDGQYRLLDIMEDVESVILYPLLNTSTSVRPAAVSLEGFLELVLRCKAKKSKYELPAYLLADEESIPEDHIVRRDKNYNLIKGMVRPRFSRHSIAI
ncbi:hypothetical protein [Enterovibrio nigricans]|uniref:Uncharacterized protein n=1 Tax=Enterovibrio nigricans DSM 22720 TaxID=1121868 RepID=A0A1T4V1B1_9GAMM|nr:hypothetical protein [Enterovibrio nigricans]SKA58729.1 hypothetical protein SAMN02745132_03030 [Enterovibrio nigricans DSM 22720]